MRTAAAIAVATLVLSPVAALGAASPSPSPHSAPAPYARLQWRQAGPAASGGRVSAIAGTDTDPFLYYVGSAGGGVFKTTDDAQTFDPVFENQPVGAIGAIAIAPRDEQTVWVATGEANPRNDASYGDGVWVSRDGGATWRHRGLDATRQISSILIDPVHPNTVLVGALGDSFADSADRGVYRTTDGGKTWTKTLYVGPQTGVSDMAWSPRRPNVVFAGMWQYRRRPWTFSSGGPQDGLYRSTDGGISWKKLQGNGLPPGLMGRIGVAVAPSNPNRVYALIQSKSGFLWRSDDGGDTWRFLSADTLVDQRPFYFSHVFVDPANADHVFTLALEIAESKNGGRTFKAIKDAPHGDFHTMWLAADGKRLAVGHDGGPSFSHDGGKTWSWPLNLAISQVYHVGFDDRVPYDVCAALQDNETFCGPSDSRDSNGITNHYWFSLNGGDGVWAWPDPLDPSLIWNDIEDGVLGIYDTRTRENVDVSPYPRDVNGIAIAGLPYRFNWDSPIAFSPQNPHTAYFGGNVVFASSDRGRHWTPISPDLTLNVKAHQQVSGGPIDLDVSGAEFSDTILDIAPSTVQSGLIWVGTDDGLVQLTRDGGAHWRNVTMRGIAAFGRVETVDASTFSAGAAFVSVDRHYSGDRSPYVFATDDFGATWRSIALGLPRDQFVRTIRQDPKNPDVLYAGLEQSVWISFDRGGHWQRLQMNLPTTSVHDLRIQPRFNDLIAGTHGRSLWILDDLTPLQQLMAAKASAPYLFPPRAAYRYWRWNEEQAVDPAFAGDNPPDGALISFYQAAKAKRRPQAQIVDSSGRVVRTLGGAYDSTVPNDAGINRFSWNITDAPPAKWRSAPKWNQGPADGAESLPGAYTVRLIDGARVMQRPLLVNPDPDLRWTQAEYERRHAFIAGLYAQINDIDLALNRLDSLRRQLAAISANAIVGAQARAAFRRSSAIRAELTSDPKNREDEVLFADKLRERVLGLADQIGGSAQPPWAADEQQAGEIRALYASVMADYHAFMERDIAALQRALITNRLRQLRY